MASHNHWHPMTTHGPRRVEATYPPTHGPTPIWSHPLWSWSSTNYNPCFCFWISLFLSLSLSLSLSLLWWEGVKGVLKTLYLLCEGLINRVLDSRFLGGRHMEKMPHQTWSDHENRVIETRFIAQNQVFETQDVSKIYTFETVPTNYIVRKMGLIPNFGPQKILNFLFSRQPCSWGKNMKNNYYLKNLIITKILYYFKINKIKYF